VVRLHNIFGLLGAYDGGREKSPAALCRKTALADDEGEIEIWGDGQQSRSRLVTIDQLAGMIETISGKHLTRRYDPGRPQGVRGRSSDNTSLRRVLGWEPEVSLETGLAATYAWIAAELERRPVSLART
jgi:GDP-D-mannose 3', 5'-epimerase